MFYKITFYQNLYSIVVGVIYNCLNVEDFGQGKILSIDKIKLNKLHLPRILQSRII